jgi:indole-3-glycerol phosphate synthase
MNILDEIVQYKRDEVIRRQKKVKLSSLQEMEYFHRKPFSLQQSLQNGKPFSIIAEIKRSSPSAGTLNNNVHPPTRAVQYTEAGARGISVLTDEKFFSGSLDDLQSVRASISIPILRKDFIIDEYQLFEAKAYGADAVLLIAAILEKSQLKELFCAARELGLECLVELYEQKEIDRLDMDQMKLIGINNRNLRTLEVNLTHSIEIAKLLPKDSTIVSESGIQSSNDLKTLKQAGITSALIGEYFMKSEHPGETLKNLLQEIE